MRRKLTACTGPPAYGGVTPLGPGVAGSWPNRISKESGDMSGMGSVLALTNPTLVAAFRSALLHQGITASARPGELSAVSYLVDHWSFDPFLIVVIILIGWHEIGLAR